MLQPENENLRMQLSEAFEINIKNLGALHFLAHYECIRKETFSVFVFIYVKGQEN